MPLIATRGAASAQGFGEFAQTNVNYIEEVFSTYLYTGTGASLTITNGIDLSTKGGLTWIKSRDSTPSHNLFDTARGATKFLVTNSTAAQATDATTLTSFNSNGFTLGTNNAVNRAGGYTYVSWTFREQSKFFDVVTWTGNAVAGRTISHNLGSVPGCIMVKSTSGAYDWTVWHRSVNTGFGVLNSTAAFNTTSSAYDKFGNDSATVAPTSASFTVGTANEVNNIGLTYVAYIFAHDAGGFGLNGTDNVISCGSFASTGAVVNVTLGYEPQFLLVKRTDGADDWRIIDSMRGFTTDKDDQIIYPNSAAAEVNLNPYIGPTATGFSTAAITGGRTYIYIAIRRGPMAVPTDATKVFEPVLYSGNAAVNREVSIGIAPDLAITKNRSGVTIYGTFRDRLRGNTVFNVPSSPGGESGTNDYGFTGPNQNSLYTAEIGTPWNASGNTYVVEALKRAPNFMDIVCYTGTGANTTQAHNLAVAPELMIVKKRAPATPDEDWQVYSSASSMGNNRYLVLNTTDARAAGSTRWNTTTPTANVFSLGTAAEVNASAATYVAYLFATCPGVSKVGSYTGTGTTLQIDCGFTGGARFVLIKRTDSTGDWYYWDSARGIVAGNDPYLLMNSTAAEVTGTDYVDTAATGFELSSTAPAALNANGGTYIFLAIA